MQIVQTPVRHCILQCLIGVCTVCMCHVYGTTGINRLCILVMQFNPNDTICTFGCWLVGCFGFNGPLRQYFSLYQAVSQREGEREKIDESKNVQTTPTRTHCKRNRPLPYCNQNCRMPRHWKFTQHHRTTRPPM